MTVKQALLKYNKVEIELLLAEVLKKPKEFLYLNPHQSLSSLQVKSLSSLVKRREKGEPMAYILGYKDFMGLRFKVNNNVLIPRPETELMAHHILGVILRPSSHLIAGRRISTGEKILRASDALRSLQDDAGAVRILDVGTGSGCIAISLAKQFSISNFQFSITASDISPAALKVAKQNAKAHKAEVQFVLSDLLKNVKGKFDIVIANLPYVPETDYKKLRNNLKYEPKNAIFSKEDGLEIIEKFLQQLTQTKILNLKSKIYLEFDPRQKSQLHRLIKKYLPKGQVKFYKDFAKHWRFVEIILKPNA